MQIKSEGNSVLAQKSIFIELAVDGSTQSKNEFHMPYSVGVCEHVSICVKILKKKTILS